MNQAQVEILAHVAAPARAADDVKYRALAAAYFDFEPARRISIVFHLDGGSDSQAGQDPSGAVEGASQRLTQPDNGLESPYLSFRSVDHNLGSPRATHGEQNAVTESQSSWRPPPSLVDDSMPNNDFILPEFFTPQRILEHYTSMVDSSQHDSPCPPPPNQAQAARRRGLFAGNVTVPKDGDMNGNMAVDKEVAAAEDRNVKENGAVKQDGSVDNATATGADVIIPRSPETSFKRRRPPEPTSFTIIEETRLGLSPPGEVTQPLKLTRADTAPLPSKRQRTTRGPEPSAPLARSATDVWPQRQKTTSTSQGYLPPPPPPTPLDDSLEIIPPPPPVSSRDLRPEDLLTDLLARLARELDLDKRFRPASQSRPLRPFERGHWLLDCRAWDPELKRSAWSFLANYLAKGAAGWGTSCRRDEAFNQLRVYCWGCTIGHIYLVLYLASRRQVLYTGARWVAGDGEVVVIMPEKGGAGDGGVMGGR
ncbi:hypothetical protein VTJ49DRAFT_5320 [Mycothermus thermophilus]|uniref:Uncharacterized protein n=1 Tax=Humicola insolens TaxID=85995 RepID=A0ABR3V4H2_HUMIN